MAFKSRALCFRKTGCCRTSPPPKTFPSPPDARKRPQKSALQVGFDPEDLKKNAVQLSGGMARRVSIVRAMLTSGDAVLLDEPFKGLDDQTREKVVQFVKETRQHRTLILVTHDPRDAKDLNAAQILNMEPV